MPRLTVSEEVQILRFFEQTPYDKAEMMLHIVCEKMRERKPAARCDERQAGGGKHKRRARDSPEIVQDSVEATSTLDG